MATTLDNIIDAIKTSALTVGFVDVQELKINKHSVSDTELPKLFIRLAEINYSNLLVDNVYEKYRIELIIIVSFSDNPISILKGYIDSLMQELINNNPIFNILSTSGKLEMVKSNLTNDRNLYSELGGEGVTVILDISNINVFGKNCQC